MPTTSPNKPRVFMDADMLFAGSAGPTEQGASLIVLRLAELTLIEAITTHQVIQECEGNLAEKMSSDLPAFRLLVNRCLRVVLNPSEKEIAPYTDLANPKDLPILVTALREACPWLVTFNVRHYLPGHPSVVSYGRESLCCACVIY